MNTITPMDLTTATRVFSGAQLSPIECHVARQALTEGYTPEIIARGLHLDERRTKLIGRQAFDKMRRALADFLSPADLLILKGDFAA